MFNPRGEAETLNYDCQTENGGTVLLSTLGITYTPYKYVLRNSHSSIDRWLSRRANGWSSWPISCSTPCGKPVSLEPQFQEEAIDLRVLGT